MSILKFIFLEEKNDKWHQFAADVSSIPDQLLHFIPLPVTLMTGLPSWIVAKNNSTQCLEVKSQKLFPIQNVCVGIVLFACAWAFFAYLNIQAINENASLNSLVWLNLIGLGFSLFMGLGAPLGWAWTNYDNSRYWKGPLNFRYRADTQELFFPREDHVYRQSECKRIILGCIISYNTLEMPKIFGIPMSGGRHRQLVGNRRYQCIILVLTNTDEWMRYEIGYGLSNTKREFDRLVTLLQPLTNCEVFCGPFA